MVLGWLKKILGQSDASASSDKKNSSLHTMGPEELLDTDETFHPAHEETEIEEFPAEENDEKEKMKVPAREKEKVSMKTKTHALRTMEAALFMGGKGLSVEELGKMAQLPYVQTREFLPELIDDFNARNSALEIVEDVGGFRMRVRAPYDEKVAHLAGSGELNPAEMKTLAFIAYKQPLLQSQLVQVRSNTAYEHLQRLVELGFVSREPKGRSYVLRTTKKFAEYFGTNALKLKPMMKEEKEGSPDNSASEEYL